jgi:ribosomal protein S27AE
MTTGRAATPAASNNACPNCSAPRSANAPGSVPSRYCCSPRTGRQPPPADPRPAQGTRRTRRGTRRRPGSQPADNGRTQPPLTSRPSAPASEANQRAEPQGQDEARPDAYRTGMSQPVKPLDEGFCIRCGPDVILDADPRAHRLRCPRCGAESRPPALPLFVASGAGKTTITEPPRSWTGNGPTRESRSRTWRGASGSSARTIRARWACSVCSSTPTAGPSHRGRPARRSCSTGAGPCSASATSRSQEDPGKCSGRIALQ